MVLFFAFGMLVSGIYFLRKELAFDNHLFDIILRSSILPYFVVIYLLADYKKTGKNLPLILLSLYFIWLGFFIGWLLFRKITP